MINVYTLNIFEGYMDGNSVINGFARYKAFDAYYIGWWKDNLIHGNGLLIDKGGNVYEGWFEKGEYIGAYHPYESVYKMFD